MEVADHQGVAVGARRDLGLDGGEDGGDVVEVLAPVEVLAAGVAVVGAAVQVVAVVVGEHGDGVGAEQRGDAEGEVLGQQPALDEAQVVLFEEGAAEEFVGGQGPVDGGVEGGDAGAGGAQVDGGGAAVGADDPAVDDVGAVGLGHAGEPVQGLGAEVVVGVEEEDVVAGGEGQADVAGAAGAARGGLGEDRQVGVVAGLSGEPGGAAVGGAVVDGDHFDAALVEGLREDRAEAAGEVGAGVVDGDDHGDGRGRVGRPAVRRVRGFVGYRHSASRRSSWQSLESPASPQSERDY